MKEQLYTIPVNDAFAADCECPVCNMYASLEQEAIEFTMGPSYMEDDIRMETNRIGFCTNHVRQLYRHKNRLGLALMLHTHMQRTNEDLEKLLSAGAPAPAKKGLFSKKTEEASPVADYIHRLNNSCYICNRVESVFQRYLVTIFHCYERDEEFRARFSSSKGFCTKHFGMLYEMAPAQLSAKRLDSFVKALNQVYLENMRRVTDELEWFTDKFDYRNENAPWKNSKDALPRSITKTNSIPAEELS